MLAARPEARWRFSPKTKRDLGALQARLLRQGALHVAPLGRLVWSTCALDADENRRAVDAFLAERAEFALDRGVVRAPAGDEGREILWGREHEQRERGEPTATLRARRDGFTRELSSGERLDDDRSTCCAARFCAPRQASATAPPPAAWRLPCG